MSSVSSKRPALAKPSFDLDYSIHDFQPEMHRDSQFYFQRIPEVVAREGALAGGRVLDVACGVGEVARQLRQKGSETWGLDPSMEMLGLSRWLFPDSNIVLVRGIAEALPFRDGSFDRVICQGSLDHFVDPRAFMREAARIVKPSGSVIIALANYESLSCHLGRLLSRLASDLLRGPKQDDRPYWRPPPDHYHKGELSFVRQLGENGLRLKSCYGISLLWLLRGWDDWCWGEWLDERPRPFAEAILTTLDRIAYRTPALADMIISVWRPQKRESS